jgi:dienelactone hydrolase
MRRLWTWALSSLLLVDICHAQDTPAARPGTQPAKQGAPQPVHFPSIGGPRQTTLDGYVFRAQGPGPHPAVVFLHGCGGLFNRQGAINSRERDWAARLTSQGISVLMVDSLRPRQHGEMCAPAHFDATIYRARSFDAYAGLQYLQSQDFVQPQSIGVVGWSQGGGALLDAIREGSAARPSTLPSGDFSMAVGFYPASCSKKRQGGTWQSPVPLMVLIGDSDVWTVAKPCRELIEAKDRNTRAEIHVYPGAYHDFDWPNLPVHEVPAFKTRAGVVPIEGANLEAMDDAVKRVTEFASVRLQQSVATPEKTRSAMSSTP